MFQHDNGHPMNPTDPLGAALRALPQAEPPGDLFAQIKHTLQARRPPRRRWIWPTAIAASVLLGLLLVRNHPVLPTPTPGQAQTSAPAPSTAAALELQRLREHSRSLERWLGGMPAGAPRDGRSLMAAAELEDLVGLVDVQLSAARSESESLPLWRQRVALLEDLAAVRSEPLALMADAGYAGPAAPTL